MRCRLAHTSLVQEAHWVHSLKMEEASFSILRKASHIFQIVDDQSYYVNHLSGYEHEVMNFQNYSFAEEKTHQLSLKAASKECESIDQYKFFNHTLSIIPFYGGRPPMVSEDLRVHSIGQGNSLVNSTTKSLQCIATACSTLRYFASSIIAVATISDKRIVEQMVSGIVIPFVSFLENRLQIICRSYLRPEFMLFNSMPILLHYSRSISCCGFKPVLESRVLVPTTNRQIVSK